MSEPWLDTWEYDADSGSVFVEPTGGDERSLAATTYTEADGRLAAAAPALVRALLVAEVHLEWGLEVYRRASMGPPVMVPHHLLDAAEAVGGALTAAGLPDRPSRDDALARMMFIREFPASWDGKMVTDLDSKP